MKRSDLGLLRQARTPSLPFRTHDDQHAPAENPCAAYSTDCAAKNQDPHVGCNSANQRTQLEDEDGKDDDMFRREDLCPLRVDQIEAE